MKRLFLLVVPFALIVGCGGGGSMQAEIKTGDSAPPPPPVAEAPKDAPSDVGTAHIKGDHIEIDQQILFDTDSDHINEEQSKGVLSDLVAILKAHPEVVHMQIAGHTDSTGSAEHNQKLSERRAAAVAKYINEHGLPNVKIETAGYGKTKPLCTEDTDACHDKNRRVEFIILK
ncbi:MAG: OmpA family protein [Polyangiaceae bacterium]|nr:OmpA family protein [Polyangiaceae bacterium]